MSCFSLLILTKDTAKLIFSKLHSTILYFLWIKFIWLVFVGDWDERIGPCSLDASQGWWRMALRWCEGGQALREEGEGQWGLCVIRPAVIIHRGWMLPALCADRDKRLLLSRGLIGLFTSYNSEGGRQCVLCVCVCVCVCVWVCVWEGEWQPLRCRIMTFIRPVLLRQWILWYCASRASAYENTEWNHNGLIKVTDWHHKHLISSRRVENSCCGWLYQYSYRMLFTPTATGLWVVCV